MKGMTLGALAEQMGAEAVGIELDRQILGVRIDSRQVLPGEVFFALPGEKTDGHAFLADAAARGAVAAIVSRLQEGAPLPLIRVDDVLLSLQNLAQRQFQERPVPLLGITGSVGKTTTKEFAAALLGGVFCVGKSPASYNSKVTYPLNLLNCTGEENLLVFEMGMSEPGEIAHLVQIAPPSIALITRIALAHAMNFSDGLEGIARAKAEIFSESQTKTVIIDWESLPLFGPISKELITFSLNDRAADYYLFFDAGRYRIDERGVRAYELDLPFHETHLLHDLLGAMAAARYLGLSWEEIERRISFLERPKMRFEQFEKAGVLFINDAYNANPASMRAALENLPEPKEGGKRIGVLASMLELGDFSVSAHEEIGRLAAKRLDALLCLGQEMAPLCAEFLQSAKKPLESCASIEEMAAKLQELMCPGDVVLIKGSRGMKLERVLDLLSMQQLEEKHASFIG